MSGYLVCDEPRGVECWMVLSLPFGYVRFSSSPSEATAMPRQMAHGYATSFGTWVNGQLRARVVETHRVPQVAKAIIERNSEAAMQAQQAAMVDMCWTAGEEQ